MFEFGWEPIVAIVLVLAIAWDIATRARRRGEATLRLYDIRDELTAMDEQPDPPQDAEKSTRQELLYDEAEQLLWQVGIDFRKAVNDIERRQAERREACRRLLEINQEFEELVLEPDSMKAAEREEKLYSEAERLLRKLDMDPAKCLKRSRPDANF